MDPPCLCEFRCALPGCRWRMLVPFGVSEQVVAAFMHHTGWRVDDQGDGFLCCAHFASATVSLDA